MANTIKDTAVRLYDGLSNLLTGMGGSLDSSRASFYTAPMLSQDQIENSYRTSWLSAAVHDIPALDATRNWRRWNADPKDITALETEEKRLGLRVKTCRSETLSRLYGGSVMMMGVRNDNPAEPLDVNTVKQGDLKYVHVIGRHQITVPSLILDPGNPRYGEPTAYQVNAGNGSYVTVDASRIVRYLPKEMPEQIALQNSGWSDPMLFLINQAIVAADTSHASMSTVISKLRTDTVTIPNLIELASTQSGEDKLKQRIQLMKAFEGLFSVRILAGGRTTNDVGETWQQWEANLSGMPEMQSMFWQAVSGASGIPVTRLLGMAPGGLQSTGDSEESNYFQLVSARQEMNLRPRLEMLDEVLIRSATGSRNPETTFVFNPLAVENQKEKADTSNVRATAIKTLSDSGTVPSDVLAKIVKAQIIDSGDYPGAEDAYKEFDAAGGDLAEINVPEEPANDNVLAATVEGLSAQGKSASVAARDAVVMLADARPMTLYVDRAVTNFAAIRAHFEGQGVTVTVDDDAAHVTLAYSRQPVDWLSVGTSDWGPGSPNLTVPEGGPRIMEVFNGTLVQIFGSSQLSYRHEEIVRAGATWDYEQFNPHFSLNYEFGAGSIEGIKPWTGPIELGCERFSEIKED